MPSNKLQSINQFALGAWLAVAYETGQNIGMAFLFTT